MTSTELHGHGDPLFMVAMKGTQFETVESKENLKENVSHDMSGHGDPLFQSVLEHDGPMNPLHTELKGQGDPLMEAFIEEWHVVPGDTHAAEKKVESDFHEEIKHHGDPLLMETIPHDTNTFGTKK
uniref:Uncharacterized protein n=1 Tax=Amphora coffeiformis TaxID=265554 RepID=A0A7S3P2J1_9STRA|eukprot:scaffold126_cov178-Amphora_coffeaeformis.AAC.7